MYIIAVILLGILFGIGTMGLWHQVCSLNDAGVYCYQKAQKQALAEGVMAYACGLYKADPKIREAVFRFKKYKISCTPGLVGPDVRAEITYEQIQKGELTLVVTVSGGKKQEVLHWKSPVQDHIFTVY